MTCTACGIDNESNRKFCGECGASLALVCPACATPNPPSVKFCGECGAALAVDASMPAEAGSPVAEPRAQLAHQRARVAALRQQGEPPFDDAVEALRESGDAFATAVAKLEQAEWLAAQGRYGEVGTLLVEARATFEQLRVPAMLERVALVQAAESSSLEPALGLDG